MKKLLSDILAKKGFILNEATERENVAQLIKNLYPYKTQFDLVRLGPNGDGGYLIPDDLEGIEACFSPGVDKISEFELDCLNRGMKLFMADRSVDAPNLNIPRDEYDFLKKFIGCTNNDGFITMDNWVKSSSLDDSSELILQMDIEGSEYNAIINMSNELLSRFRIMVIEFHFLDKFWNPHFFNPARTVFEKILETHICVHIHPNNCCGIDTQFEIDIPRVAEFTFLRKDRVRNKDYQNEYPHELDFDNVVDDSIILPKNWYKSA